MCHLWDIHAFGLIAKGLALSSGRVRHCPVGARTDTLTKATKAEVIAWVQLEPGSKLSISSILQGGVAGVVHRHPCLPSRPERFPYNLAGV